MPDVRLIALDLDGTLLNSDKQLSEANRAALQRAADRGIFVVPTTGRFFNAMPEVIRALPYLKYAITINGAAVEEAGNPEPVYKAEIPNGRAVEIMEYLDTLPVIYDCYTGGAGYMTAALRDRAEEFAPDVHYLKMIRELRQPVEELKAYIRSRGAGIQKIQFFIKDPDLRLRLLKSLPERFPDVIVTSSVANNIEFNHRNANKGKAVLALADYLGIPRESTVSFGDGLNDLSMIEAAGIGVAMANACPEVLEAADMTASSCDEDGVAKALLELGI